LSFKTSAEGFQISTYICTAFYRTVALTKLVIRWTIVVLSKRDLSGKRFFLSANQRYPKDFSLIKSVI